MFVGTRPFLYYEVGYLVVDTFTCWVAGLVECELRAGGSGGIIIPQGLRYSCLVLESRR